MGYSKLDYQLSDEWTDLTEIAGYEDITSADIEIHAKYVNPCYVFVGGATPPINDNGVLLTTGNKIASKSDHWWVKGKGFIAILVVNDPII